MKMVADKHIYHVSAQWGPRPEPPEALASRWLALIERLQGIDPALAKWTHWEKGRGFVPFDPRIEVQKARVIGGMTRTRDGRLFPHLGSRIWVTTDPCPRPRCFAVWMEAGGNDTNNYISGETDPLAIPNPALVAYDVLRGVMLAAAETFEARQARVYSSDLRQFWPNSGGIGKKLDLAWISYVAPRFAHLVSPPPSVVAERRPDGGLLMAATKEPFSTDNPAHLDAARAIKEALAPYNAVPWTAEAGTP